MAFNLTDLIKNNLSEGIMMPGWTSHGFEYCIAHTSIGGSVGIFAGCRQWDSFDEAFAHYRKGWTRERFSAYREDGYTLISMEKARLQTLQILKQMRKFCVLMDIPVPGAKPKVKRRGKPRRSK